MQEGGRDEHPVVHGRLVVEQRPGVLWLPREGKRLLPKPCAIEHNPTGVYKKTSFENIHDQSIRWADGVNN